MLANQHTQAINELYKPVRINFPRRRFELRRLHDVIELDIADMSNLSRENDGHHYFLLANIPFSKKIFTVPLKTKGAREVATATKLILRKARLKFKKIFTDRGSEFKNTIFKREIEDEMGIEHYYSYSVKKCPHAERSIGTVKRKIYKMMGLKGSMRWLDFLPKLTSEINNTPHSRFKFKPNEVNRRNEHAIYEQFYSQPRETNIPKFKIGDKVRKSEPPTMFRRSFYPNWSPAVYSVVAVNRKVPNVYKLKDYYGKTLKGESFVFNFIQLTHLNFLSCRLILYRRISTNKVS